MFYEHLNDKPHILSGEVLCRRPKDTCSCKKNTSQNLGSKGRLAIGYAKILSSMNTMFTKEKIKKRSMSCVNSLVIGVISCCCYMIHL